MKQEEIDRQLDEVAQRLAIPIMNHFLCSRKEAESVAWNVASDVARFGRGQYWRGRVEEESKT